MRVFPKDSVGFIESRQVGLTACLYLAVATFLVLGGPTISLVMWVSTHDSIGCVILLGGYGGSSIIILLLAKSILQHCPLLYGVQIGSDSVVFDFAHFGSRALQYDDIVLIEHETREIQTYPSRAKFVLESGEALYIDGLSAKAVGVLREKSAMGVESDGCPE
jgi:hypothetical protein